MTLTAKQERFCELYVILRNATRAALEAGYAPSYANRQGSENLSKPDIQARIAELQDDEQRALSIRVDSLLLSLQAKAHANVLDFIEWDARGNVKLKPSAALDRDVASGIASIKQGPHGIELKLVDTIRATELLGRHLGLFDSDESGGPVEVSIINDNRILVEAAHRIGQEMSIEELRVLAQEAREARGLVREELVGRLEK